MDRTGKTFEHKASGSVVVVTKSRQMSAGTSRHTLLVIAAGAGSFRKDGEQCDVDEVPVEPFERNWKEI
jgi:hypothetical protein